MGPVARALHTFFDSMPMAADTLPPTQHEPHAANVEVYPIQVHGAFLSKRRSCASIAFSAFFLDAAPLGSEHRSFPRPRGASSWQAQPASIMRTRGRPSTSFEGEPLTAQEKYEEILISLPADFKGPIPGKKLGYEEEVAAKAMAKDGNEKAKAAAKAVADGPVDDDEVPKQDPVEKAPSLTEVAKAEGQRAAEASSATDD